MKEQIEAYLRDGKIMAACLLFADMNKIPASEVYAFARMAFAFEELTELRRFKAAALTLTTEQSILHVMEKAK